MVIWELGVVNPCTYVPLIHYNEFPNDDSTINYGFSIAIAIAIVIAIAMLVSLPKEAAH